MHYHFSIPNALMLSMSLLASMAYHAPVEAQVLEVVVGITPNCPYGLEACWGVAREGLSRLEGVESIVGHPDVYNCTARVNLNHEGLPKLEKWPDQFKSVVGEIQFFRGVEVTAKGIVEEKGDRLLLLVPGLRHPIGLATLDHKLQWNFKKKARRGPEPDEQAAYGQLVSSHHGRGARAKRLKVEVTGPLMIANQGPVLEVREFYLLSS